MANIYDPETWSEFPEEVKNKLYVFRELFFTGIDKQENNLQEEPE